MMYGELDSVWSALATEDDAYVVRDRFVLFNIADVAIYLVEEGNRITVSPIGEPRAERIRLFLDGYAMAALLLQRGTMPLHGSAVVIDGKAYAIVGGSGAGKSTLTKAFLEQGYSFLSDDVIPVSLAEDGTQGIVMPALKEQKLWQECLPHFNMSQNGLDTVYEREEHQGELTGKRTKYAIPVSRFHQGPLPLGGIFELVKSQERDHVMLAAIHKAEKLRTILQHTFHRMLIPPLGLLEWHFGMASTLVNSTPMYKLERPVSRFTASELLTLMTSTALKERSYERIYYAR